MQNIRDFRPLVSIGVPVYNGDKYLAECLESVHNQTYQNWECFIINNRSTDNTLVIAESFEKNDSRFKVITNPEFVDMTANFNNTFKSVSKDAKYFKVVCADDWIFPEYLDRMVSLMEKHPEAGICSSHRIDNKKVSCHGLDYYKGPVFSGKEVLLQQLKSKLDITGSETTVMYRIEILKKIKGFPVIFSYDSYHFDTLLAYELLSISDLAFVFQVLSYTRRHEETYTSKYVDRFRTSLNFREKELFTYRPLFPELAADYKQIRSLYGIYLLKAILIRDIKSIEWHKKHLDANRRYTLTEYIKSIIYQLIHKLKNKLKGDNQ
jgi:glycosyltransferase involved in cell wall biosynthesis